MCCLERGLPERLEHGPLLLRTMNVATKPLAFRRQLLVVETVAAAGVLRGLRPLELRHVPDLGNPAQITRQPC